MKRKTWFRGSLLVALVMASPLAIAADHRDSPTLDVTVTTTADPSVDITDVFTWMDGSNVVLVLNVFPAAMTTSKFSNTTQYVLHTESHAAFGAAATAKTDIICTFDATQKISCWIGTADYVNGDASNTSGLMSTSGKVKVFAGLRDDPFFFNLQGFKDTVAYVEGLSPAPTADGSGCPMLSTTQATTAAGYLSKTGSGANPAKDFFAGLNVLSIVLSVDKGLLTTSSAPMLTVWGSTNKGS